MPDETIDIQFSLMDRDALEAFTKELADASKTLADAKQGMRSTPPTTPETPEPVAGRSTAASVATPSPIVTSGGASSGSQPGILSQNVRTVQDIPNPNQRTAEDAFRGLNPLSGGPPLGLDQTYPLTQQAITQAEASQTGGPLGQFGQSVSSLTGRIPVVGPTLGAAFNANSIGEGLSFAMANHIGPAIASSQAVQIGQGFNPFTASQIGYEQGLTGGPTVGIGPFQAQLPTGPAFSSGFGDVLHAITTGAATGGLSTGQVYSNEELLHAAGFANYPSAITAPSNQGSIPSGPGTSAEDYNALRNLVETIQKPRSEGGLEVKGLDPQFLVTQVGDMMRYGQATQEDVLNAFSGLGEAARSANLSINDFAEQVSGAADALQQMGPVTNAQAFQAASDFSTGTHLPPSAMPGLMQSPFIQAQLTAQTGLPSQLLPGAVASDPTLLTSATRTSMNMMSQAFKGMFQPLVTHHGGPMGFTTTESSNEQAQQMAAAQLGIPLDQYKDMQNRQQQIGIQTTMTSGVDALQKRIAQISKLPGGSGQLAAIEYGHGKGVDFQDLINLAKKPNSGIDPADIRNIRSSGDSPESKAREISNLIKQSRPGRVSPNQNKTYVAFTGYAEKLLRQVVGTSTNPTGDAANTTMNQGGAKSTSQYLKNAPPDPQGYIRGSSATTQADVQGTTTDTG